jgi:hypothetical protein
MIHITSYKLFESENKNLIKVIRWSKEKIPAVELKSQNADWGGFEMYGLSFAPYDFVGDDRYEMWKNDVSKHHKSEVFPNHYLLDISMLPYNTEGKLIDLAMQAYSTNRIISNEAVHELKKMNIFITLSRQFGNKLKIVEFRILEGSPVKILDDIS